MEKTYVKLNSRKVPDGLAASVIGEIRARERAHERRRARAFSIVAFAAFLAAIPSLENVWSRAAQSGFAGYASLLFSDGGAVAGIWKTFALSLAETAPLFALSIAAAVILVLAWSTAEALKYTKAARLILN